MESLATGRAIPKSDTIGQAVGNPGDYYTCMCILKRLLTTVRAALPRELASPFLKKFDQIAQPRPAHEHAQRIIVAAEYIVSASTNYTKRLYLGITQYTSDIWRSVYDNCIRYCEKVACMKVVVHTKEGKYRCECGTKI